MGVYHNTVVKNTKHVFHHASLGGIRYILPYYRIFIGTGESLCGFWLKQRGSYVTLTQNTRVDFVLINNTTVINLATGTHYPLELELGIYLFNKYKYPESKVHRTKMGSIWGREDPGGPHVGPMNFVIWV